jgi:2-polyprenyl-3-methyl-5-hydroxy-6-metoxy-1,4-benzoquinol methylase
MDVVERLTLEAAQADTMLACEHRHRYALAARLCRGRRVLDLCCGSGYGSAILAETAQAVTGVDHDAATVELASATVAREHPNVSFELAGAVSYLGGAAAQRFDVIVCFEGLEHLAELDRALALLREHAERGTALIVSVPNDKMLGEDNPFHLTKFGYDEARAAFGAFPRLVMLPQFLAEGSLICAPGAQEVAASVTLEGRDEPEYANHFLCFVNFEATDLERVHDGNLQVQAAPLFNRWGEGMKQTVVALRRENARLARARLGKAGSAAASALTAINDREALASSLQERCELAETRVAELEAVLAAARDGSRQPPAAALEPPASSQRVTVQARAFRPVAESAGADADGPGSQLDAWELDRRRAAEVLVPWIEQTLSLAGRTMLHYGCGAGAESCALAQRAGRVIGFDLDEGRIQAGGARLRAQGVKNVELSFHPAERIADAVAALTGQVDVVLLAGVLARLAPAARLRLLRAARALVSPDGAIVVWATPNRLTYLNPIGGSDPFSLMLPDELARAYAQRSGVAAPSGKAAEEGVSFHEFELVFAQLSSHLLASSYDPLLFGERPVAPEELMLARRLDRVRPDLAPAWSRAQLDLILSPEPVPRRAPFLRPWTMDTTESVGVSWSGRESLAFAGPGAALTVTLPHPTGRLVLGASSRDGRAFSLDVAPEAQDLTLVASHRAPARQTSFASCDLERPARRVALRAGDECQVGFIGFED